MGRAGRKSKRTPEVDAKIRRNLEAGNTRRTACALAGISEDTFARWLREFADFAELVDMAEAKAEAKMVAVVRSAATKLGDYKAALEWLKRRRKKEWGDSVQIGEDPESPMLGTFTAAIEKIYGAKEPEETKDDE